MTQGYKCDNCTTFKERKEDIKEHEKECSLILTTRNVTHVLIL